MHIGKWTKPATEKQRDGNGAHHEDVAPFGKHIERPAEAAELGVITGDELGFGFGKVEGNAIGFSNGRDHEDEKWKDHGAVVGEEKPPVLCELLGDDGIQAKGAGHSNASEQAEAECYFVADKLGGAAKRSEQRIVSVG